MNNKYILILGSGYMATEYLKVIADIGYTAILVGRGKEKINLLRNLYPDFIYYYGGIEKYLVSNDQIPAIAINTVNIEFLRETTIMLLKAGIMKILIEKPGDLTVEGLEMIETVATKQSAEVYIAYNRRFYSSVMELKKQAELDGGIISAHFEFTEWINTIAPAFYEKETLKRWVISNSSHVIDTVFYLIGLPKVLNCSIYGENVIPWHSSGSIFLGQGISENDIPFTYHSNWQAPGRWSIEILTKKRRYYLKPMEKLNYQDLGSIQINEFNPSYNDNLNFKPGLYKQVQTFLFKKDKNKLCNIRCQIENLSFINKIAGYF